MQLTPARIVELSRLLDEVLPLESDQREAWLAGLQGDRQDYVPCLRDMLRKQGRMGESLLATLPRLADPEVDAVRAGDLVGPYRLIRLLGSGGMSVVWLAERADEGLRRQVALKLPLLILNTPRQLERFGRERDVLAGLEHAHIARLYDAGTSPEGRPYLVLECVYGEPLTRYCEERCLSLPARLRLFLQVLDAVAYAHAHLVVHRDIKPANILVDGQGQVKLLDFGIAKLLPGPGQAGDHTPATLYSGWAMTPRYAAPEQLQGQPVTTTTDVYALGVVLYELLTGQWPYAAAAAGSGGPRTVSEVMRAVLDTEPARPSGAILAGEVAQRQGGADPRRLAAALRGDLDTILLKALCKLPSQRYASAERFADDLRRFLARQPIAARPPVWTYRARLFLRRHRHASLAASVAACLAMTFGATTWQQYRQSIGYQERAVVMRDFMVGLINDAEPDQNQPDQAVTALQMLDGAARRARKDYGDRPRLQGELLAELGRMYLQLGEARLAQPLLADALALLERTAPASDPALNQARAQLAGLLVEYGEVARQTDAAALATEAIHLCRGQPAECARVRAEAWDVLAYIEISKDGPADVLLLMHQVVEEARLGYGASHSRTLQALNDQAVTARNAGLFMEADRMMDELLAAADGQTLRAAVRNNILHLKARLDCDLGRYASARRQVEDLIAQAPGRSGPALDDRGRSRPNDQLVGMLRSLSAVLLEQGDPLGASRAADSAVALFRPEQRPGEVLSVRQSRVEARSLLEPSGPVLDEAQAVIDGMLALGQAPDAISVRRARRVRGELLARQGQLVQARLALEAALGQATPGQPATPHAVLQAVTLDQLGSVLRELGLVEEALRRHEAARALLLPALPHDHPYLARNALYREAARAASAGGVDRTTLLTQAELYKRLFPEDSIWRRIVDRYLGPACQGAAGRPGPRPYDCLLLL